MSAIAIIPARMGSSRFPGKPLAKINGVPMVEMVLKKVLKSKSIEKAIVATCDKEIFDHIQSIGGEVVMTSTRHDRASDRCNEALSKYEKKIKKKFDIVVMVQGDEPMVTGQMVDQSVSLIKKSKKINVVNLVCNINRKIDYYDKNCVKVICSKFNTAIVFSRSPIPYLKNFKKKIVKKQVCIIPFKRKFLKKYSSMTQTKMEKLESIDMLRVIENGYQVHLVKIKKETFPVDTLKDLKKVSKILKNEKKN